MLMHELGWRGLVHQTTHNSLSDRLDKKPIVLYVGFDPTSDSLHIGNLVQILALQRAQKLGHHPIALIGGATAIIGDPSGKTTERGIIQNDIIEKNIQGIKSQLESFLEFTPEMKNPAVIVNNIEWFKDISYLSFLKEIGKYISVNQMLSRDSVQSRMSTGISYTEFSYMLAQAYDYLQLNERYGCELQVGGSDQWGNITMGIDLLRKLKEKEVFGLTQPLIVDSTGKKIGKTEKGTIFLDKNKTSVFDFYQYFVKTKDEDVLKFLKYFTNLTEEQMQYFESVVKIQPEKREAQQELAFQVTQMVQGIEEANKAKETSERLFYGKGGIQLTPSEEEHSIHYKDLQKGIQFLNLAARVPGWFQSKTEARRVLEGKGLRINGLTIEDPGYVLTLRDIQNDHIMIQKGKQHRHLIKIRGTE